MVSHATDPLSESIGPWAFGMLRAYPELGPGCMGRVVLSHTVGRMACTARTERAYDWTI